MSVLREENEFEKYRLLENFWSSQIRSKSWLINIVNQHLSSVSGNVYVMGGWYGVLAQFLSDNLDVNKIYSIDIDAKCEIVGRKLSGNDEKIIFLTRDMKNFTNYINPGLIINTSTEHITEDDFNQWLSNVPNDVPVVLQGNNLFDCSDHIRCSETLEEFVLTSKLNKILYNGSLDCETFQRFMVVGYKK
jgi:hypothetical protein